MSLDSLTGFSGMTPSPTDSFGVYTLVRQLNRGATAIVYEAEEMDSSSWRTPSPRVALKVFNERPGGGFTIPISTIQQEIRCASCLQHKHIAQLLDVIPHGDRLGLAFELVEGPDLLDYIKRFRSRVPEELAMHYFRQMVLAVQHIHEMQIVHRDLKPENCMIDPETHTLKVIDFGLAASSSDPCLTGCGTINTIAPECIAVDTLPSTINDPEAVDVWGLGVTLYIMLSGSYPFQDHQQPHCDESHKKNILNGRIHALPARITSATRSLVRKILQVNPDDRLKLDQILHHPALNIASPSPSLFEGERRLFSAMGSRVSSYASEPSDVSPERLRPTPLPVRVTDLLYDMDYESSPPSSSPPSSRSRGLHPSNQDQAHISPAAQRTSFEARAMLSSSRSWKGLASLASPWEDSVQKTVAAPSFTGSLRGWSQLPSASASLAASPASRRDASAGPEQLAVHRSPSKADPSLTSQLAMIEAALQEESDRAIQEANQVAQHSRMEDYYYDDSDAEFASEFDVGDKAQIWSAPSCSALQINCKASFCSEATDGSDVACSMDSSCSLPWSPKDATDRPSPIRLFSVSSSDLSPNEGPSGQPSPSGPGLGRLKAVPSFQQLSPFRSFLSDIPEELDEAVEEALEIEDEGKQLGNNSLSMRSDTTTYEPA